eukprot:Pgem_evm2s18839
MSFKFYKDNEISFECSLKTIQCEHNMAYANRCKRKFKKGGSYCWQHTKYKNMVVIKKSRIPGAGMGLFACNTRVGPKSVVFEPGQIICLYQGEYLSKTQVNQRYQTNDREKFNFGYVLEPRGRQFHKHRPKWVDASCQRGHGSYANSSNNPNAEYTYLNRQQVNQWNIFMGTNYVYNASKPIFALRSIRDITNHSEILLNYPITHDHRTINMNTNNQKCIQTKASRSKKR